MTQRHGWPSLAEWTLAFGLVTYAILGLMTIGIFVVPFAIAAVVIAGRRNRGWPEAMFGGFLGVASICLLVAFLNRDYSLCPTTIRLGPGDHFRCGGRDPMPWLSVGGLLAATGLMGYTAFRLIHRNVAT